MKIKTRIDQVKLIPENREDRKSLSAIQGIFDNNPWLVEHMENLSKSERKALWHAIFTAYCAGLSNGRLFRQLEIDSPHSYQT